MQVVDDHGGARSVAPLLLFVLLGACSEAKRVQEAPPAAQPGQLFTHLPSSYTGVEFANRLTETRDFNVFTYRNFYNGGGVAIGDLSGDSRPESAPAVSSSGSWMIE